MDCEMTACSTILIVHILVTLLSIHVIISNMNQLAADNSD